MKSVKIVTTKDDSGYDETRFLCPDKIELVEFNEMCYPICKERCGTDVEEN